MLRIAFKFRRTWPTLLGSASCVVSLLCAPAVANGQSLPLPPIGTEAQIVAAAHAEGARFSRVAASVHVARSLWATSPALRTCVPAYEMGPASSGEFTIGGNLSGSRAMRSGWPGKVWWAPVHNSLKMPPLLVRGRSLSNPQDTVRFISSNVAWPGRPGATPIPEAERKYFFPSGITIPQPGRWLLIATSGANWGCFVITVL